ncbi:uncharacterized protein LOC133801236 [Humulus lupulus]|uniref:uncharacterized protein LOC133801236 n=1 Tax=Humulus lupulus TaxID=3486 RepID=UPI002B400ED5|nr:uncharacterized protein LOC133801236 [Humulus lupulus]
MGVSIELKSSSKLPNITKPAQERVFLPPLNRIPKSEGRLKAKNHVDSTRSNMRWELARDTAKSSGSQYSQRNKGKLVGDGELVKHMSNLPVYLQRVEKGENYPEKVLNVGVLDWTRLEQWKHGNSNVLEKGSTSTSCSSSYLTQKRNIGSSRSSSLVHAERLSEQHPSLCSSLVSSHEDGPSQDVKILVRNTARFQDLETSSKNTIAARKNVSQSFKSFERHHSSAMVEREKIKDEDWKNTPDIGRGSGKYKSFGTSHHPKESLSSWEGRSKKTIDLSHESDSLRTNTDKKSVSEIEAMSTKLGSYDVSAKSKESKSSGSLGTKIRAQGLQQVDTDKVNQRVSEKGNSIVLLLPKESPQKGYREVFQLSQRRKSFDQNLTGLSKNSLSEDSVSTNKINSSKLFPDIPHSCPLASSVETNTISDRIRNGMTSDYSAELSSAVSHTLSCPEKTEDLHYKDKYVTKNQSDVRATNSSALDRDPIATLNQEASELTASNSRNPSPHRRFSFSLGRMGRSLSFKEGSTASSPQLSSKHVTVKSGPLTANASDCGDNPNKDKVKGHNRARSSPLRRLLDPLLKHREENPPHPSESGLLPKGSFSSFSGPVYSFPNEKVEECQVQALLQLIINNGIPLFRFVVNNNSNILAATIKNRTSSKDDSGSNFTFYMVNEIKKKSGGWISQGSKMKYVYNVVGQMKVSTSDFSCTSEPDNDEYMLRESVLFGVERKQVDQGSPKFIPNRELAAAVVKVSRKHISHEHQTDKESMEKGCDKCSPQNQSSLKVGENEHLNHVTVILPGGVHSMPNKGEPSPLVHRWKSGGSCDCGGWDVGCKLQVLSDEKNSPKGLFSDCLELHVEGGGQQQNSPTLSLMPSKDGIYSVEYNTSITRLQAFFICVAVLCSQKVPDLSTVTTVPELSKVFDQSDMSDKNGYQVKLPLPTKYAPTPPLSPVGRV